ncbi:hypothetical protein GCM10023317_76050 [Actinopolymorpha pittospori]|uniref:RimJ/RimL family protein N-acetyltransferase n=2 Tax=Actinopolymorpha pittospori TaxID=648752 RepID=A0A927N6H6_9ACTN|nr:RimJ/RimL family protein N-acetyltransferase [Actinopolymorpha pittospori]
MADMDRSHLGLTAPIVTARLVLRSVETADDEMLTRIWTDPDVRRYMGGPLEPGVVRHRNTDFVGKPGKYCVAIRATGEPIGLLGIGADRRSGNWEVSYGFLPEHWRRGYAREAVHALLVWVFERAPRRNSSRPTPGPTTSRPADSWRRSEGGSSSPSETRPSQ